MPELEHLSYSSVSSYQLCARSWRFKYLDKIPVPTAPALAFGSAFHGTIENMVKTAHAGGKADPVAVWTEQWAAATEQDIAWGTDRKEQLSNEGIRLLTHKDTLATIHAIKPLVENGEPVIERRVELSLPNVPIPIIGYIDLITEDGAPGDFKTAARSWTQDQAQNEMQPLFYLAALNQLGWTLNPEYRFRHFIFVKTKTPQVQVIESTRRPAELFWILRTVQEVWKGIEREVFPPNPSSWKCSEKYCEFWGCCRGKH